MLVLGNPTTYRLHQFRVHNPAYDGAFKPQHGALRVTYNGADIDIKVAGKKLSCIVNTHETCFSIMSDLRKAGCQTWNDILYHIMQHVIHDLVQLGIHQLVYMKQDEERVWYVH